MFSVNRAESIHGEYEHVGREWSAIREPGRPPIGPRALVNTPNFFRPSSHVSGAGAIFIFQGPSLEFFENRTLFWSFGSELFIFRSTLLKFRFLVQNYLPIPNLEALFDFLDFLPEIFAFEVKPCKIIKPFLQPLPHT